MQLSGIEINSSLEISSITSDAKSSSYRIRELIFEATKKGTNISNVYKETLRGMLDLFNGYSIIDGEDRVKPVKAIHANPERPVAKLIQEDNLVLPIISVSQPTTSNNPDRAKYFPMILWESVWSDKLQRATRVVSLSPKPIDIEYRVVVWSKYKADLDQLTEQIYQSFNPGFELQTSYSNNTKAFLEGESDASEVEVADREDRILKRSFTIVVQTYVPSPKFLFTSTGKIETFEYESDIS